MAPLLTASEGIVVEGAPAVVCTRTCGLWFLVRVSHLNQPSLLFYSSEISVLATELFGKDEAMSSPFARNR